MKIDQAFTSIEAFHSHQASGKAAAQRNRILMFITERGGDWAIAEIAVALGMKDNIVSARVNELVYETRELEAKQKRRSRVSNVTIRPVGLPEQQYELALEAA